MESQQDVRRPTIGYLAPNISDGVGATRWYGVLDVAREQDVNLICFPGQYWRDPGPKGQANAIYDLVNTEYLDGLVLGNIVQGGTAGRDKFKDFYKNRLQMPVVSIRETLSGIPYIPLDNYQGMREAIVHLIEVHEYRRIAFLRGPEQHPYAQERYRAYTDVLQEYGFPFQPDLVTPPSGWNEPAIQVLLDERQLSPPADFEAVVAVNDSKALNALRVLQARGLRTPKDVAVVGFNDDVEARIFTPPLTSVALPFYEQGRQAAEMLLAMLRGEEVPEQMILSARLVVRQSCGCPSREVARAGAGPATATHKELTVALAAQRDEIIIEMVQGLGEFEGISEQAEQLLDAFVAELTAKVEDDLEGAFLYTLNEVLRQAGAIDDSPSTHSEQDVIAWQGALSALRKHLVPYLTDNEASSRADDLLHQARVTIGETAERARMRQALQTEQHAQRLREVGTTLITTFDTDEVMDVLADCLPRLGIPSASLSLYEDPESPAAWSRLVLAYDAEGRAELEAEGQRFPSRQLAPKGMLPQGRQYCIVVEPLYFRERQLGFALFELGPRKGSVYDSLRGEMSSALHGALLLHERQRAEEELERAYAEVEKQVEERTAELQRETAERLRAQEESARLQQEVIEAQKHALQELSTPIIPVMDQIIVVPLIGSIDTARARDITRRLLAGIRTHQARVVILDITGVPVVDSGVANHLNKTIQAAQLKGVRAIITGISSAVAEIIVDLGIDWSDIETLSDLQSGLLVALSHTGARIARER